MLRKITLVLLIGVTLPAWSEIYKWVDEDGTVHYSDKKPRGSETTQVKVSTGKESKPGESVDQQINNLETQEEIDKVRKEQEIQTAEAEKAKQEYCEKLKANLETLANNVRIRTKGEDGELRFLTPEEIVEKRQSGQKSFDEKCK